MLSLADVRRRAVVAQAYARRPASADAADVREAIRRLSCVQLDSISTVDRSHRLVLTARVGAYDERVVSDLLRKGKAFEYWAHEACLIPVEDLPLFRRRMRERREHHWWGDVIGGDRRLARAILRRIERDGPVKASDFEGRSGGMWELKPEKKMLEALWTAGKLAVSGREGFQRVYDLAERVLPARALDAPLPSERETLRALSLRAVEARGALTAAGVAEHYRIAGRAASVRPHLDALARTGELEAHAVEDGGPPVFTPVAARAARSSHRGADAGTLLSPFDNLLWDRAMLRRFWGFDHVMEIYKRPHERKFGYYVLPFLHGDALVARVDLKSDREAGALVVKAVHRVPGAPWTGAREDALQAALSRLARNVGLSTVAALTPKP